MSRFHEFSIAYAQCLSRVRPEMCSSTIGFTVYSLVGMTHKRSTILLKLRMAPDFMPTRSSNRSNDIHLHREESEKYLLAHAATAHILDRITGVGHRRPQVGWCHIAKLQYAPEYPTFPVIFMDKTDRKRTQLERAGCACPPCFSQSNNRFPTGRCLQEP